MIHQPVELAMAHLRRVLSDRCRQLHDGIAPDTRLYEDLGVYGDDWDEIAQELDAFRRIDWVGFDADRFFPGEPHLMSWWVRLVEWLEGRKRRPLTVGHLARVAARGQWFEPDDVAG